MIQESFLVHPHSPFRLDVTVWALRRRTHNRIDQWDGTVYTLEAMNNEEAKTSLSSMRGVGRWTAEYVLLRGLGRLDTFPGDDVGAQKNLQNLLHLEEKPPYEKIKEVTSLWQLYAGFVYFHLLLDKLDKQGILSQA
jgi:DNA-3-methyladenine glycosylase II